MQATKRTIESLRHEWLMSSPVHWSEVEKAVAVARQERQAAFEKGHQASDVFISSENDETVIVGWTEDRKL